MADYQQKLANLLVSPNSEDKLGEFLNRLQLAGQYGTSAGQGTNTSYGGGRIGYNFPMGEGNLNAGVGFNGYNAKGDWGKSHDFGVNNLDAAYSWGNNTVGGNINPDNKDFNVYYRKQF